MKSQIVLSAVSPAVVARSPSWVLLPAAAAPLLLLGGWTLAAGLRREDFNQVTQPLSALAAVNAPNRWLMTFVFAVLGVCYVLTAWGLNCAALPGRLLLAAGGVATTGVAAVPLPSQGPSVVHSTIASVAFVALACWPLLARRNARRTPWALRPMVSVTVTLLLCGLLVWFGIELNTGGRIGLAEGIAAGAEATWPLLVAVATLRPRRNGESAPRDH